MVDAFMTPKQRVVASALGSIPGMIGIPVVMSTWAPTWAVLVWVIGYASFTVTAWVLLLRTERNVEQWWSSAVGISFGLLPISATVWDSGTRSYWIAASLVMIAIATEVSSLPYIKIEEWRVGVVTSGTMVIVAGLFEIGVVSLVLAPVLYTIVASANRMRTTKTALENARNVADTKTAEAERLAHLDELTGLLNRRGVASEVARLSGRPYTMLMVDGDRFKAINDSHGYAAGDQVIQQIARVLDRRLGPSWVVGRPGGDEFVALALGNHQLDPTTCAPVTCKVSQYGTTSSLTIGLSGGHVVSPGGENPDTVMSKAGYAMRAAKRARRPMVTFDHALNQQFDRMLEISTPSGQQMRASSLTAQFQIIVDDDERIVGCEALSRWQRPDGSLVPPADFLPVLADNGQMPILNEVMLTQGIEFAARFNGHRRPPFVAVNIGSSSLTSTNLASLVSALLQRHKVAAHRLMIEITETEGLGHDATWEAAAADLRALGVQLAIDDFGSGYSNIERLNQLPISHLKFDRSLTAAVSGPLGQIARGVVDFAGHTGIGIIAEGIETEEELAAMRAIGVRFFQGYHFGRPANPDEVESLITNSTTSRRKLGA